jgi:hypothetical protein
MSLLLLPDMNIATGSLKEHFRSATIQFCGQAHAILA